MAVFTKILFFAILGFSFVLAFSTPDRNDHQHEQLSFANGHKSDVDLTSPIADNETLENEEPKNVTITATTSTTQPIKESRWQRAKRKFNSLKSRCDDLFNKVKADWHIIKNTIRNVKKSFSKAKNHTLELINEAEIIFKKIVVNGENAFHEFQTVFEDLKNSIKDLKEEGGDFFKSVKILIKDLNDEKADIQVAFATGELKKLKENWNNDKNEWTKVKTSFDHMFNKLTDDYRKTKNDTRVLINGVKKDLEDIKKETNELLMEAKRTYQEIIVGGIENAYAKFKKSYDNLKLILDILNPEVDVTYEVLKDLLAKLNSYVDQHEKLVELKAVPTGSGSVVAESAV